ncbi:MAG: hypothetical protein JSW16_09190 [Dehalococcoidales bacterium]|nr:MAG: hypothetical protein JSW16_09190 [Dehalococcoidales bacterium]
MEELNKEASGEDLIKTLEESYFDLRKNNPGRDEHWFLANTWLKRYGSGEEVKQRGAEWTRFTAYKDTHEFAILEPPASIRGFALLMINRELGEQQASSYEKEFFQILEPVILSKKNQEFLDKYKKKNPLTWEEIQVEDESNYSLHWFFRSLELKQEYGEEIEGGWDEFGIDIIDVIDDMEEEGEYIVEEEYGD